MKRWLVCASVMVVVAVTTAVSLGFGWPFRGNGRQLRLPGTVEAHELRLGSKVGGRVAEILIREGELVSEDVVLVRFEVPELQAQRKQLEEKHAAAKLELRKLEIRRPKDTIEAKALFEAAQVRLERAKTGWREELIQQAKDELRIAQAEFELSRKNLDRLEKVRSQVSQFEYETAFASFRVAEGRRSAAETKVAMVTKGGWELDTREAAADVERTQARFEANRDTEKEDLAIAVKQIAELEARLAEIQAQWAESEVKSPSRMVVEVLGVRKGDLVAPNTPVIRGLQLDERWVKAFVPSTQLGRLRLDQDVEVGCDAYPGKRFRGKIIQIATISEFTPRNVQSADEREHQVFGVKVRVDDDGLVFKPGMAAEVFVPLHDAP